MNPAPENCVLAFENIGKTFREKNGKITRALDNANLILKPGSITALVGPDGAGKTTLLRIAAGLLAPDEGTFSLFGEEVTGNASPAFARIGYMPQKFGLYEDLSVQENLDLYADLRNLAQDERENRYAALLKMTGLSKFTDRLAGRLSGGMKQKLGLICTLVKAPEILLLDEPTVGVDPLSRRELWEIIKNLTGEGETSLIVSTSYLDEAARCDEILLLFEGTTLAKESPDALKNRSASQSLEDSFMLLLEETKGAPGRRADAEKPEREKTGRKAPGEDEIVIETKNVTKKFGDFIAVNDISFSVNRGEVFGLLGPNGAGKTTTFRMLCGLLPATSGSLRVAGVDVRSARSDARRRIGYVAQKFSLYGLLTVRENLEFFAGAYGLFGKEREERMNAVLEDFSLTKHTETAAEDLPGGSKQRLAMAVGLLHRPQILFLDEPTSGADPLARREFWLRISSLAASGVTIIVTTHFMEEAEYCDRILIQDSGVMLALDTPATIRAQTGAPNMEEAFIRIVENARRENGNGSAKTTGSAA